MDMVDILSPQKFDPMMSDKTSRVSSLEKQAVCKHPLGNSHQRYTGITTETLEDFRCECANPAQLLPPS